MILNNLTIWLSQDDKTKLFYDASGPNYMLQELIELLGSWVVNYINLRVYSTMIYAPIPIYVVEGLRYPYIPFRMCGVTLLTILRNNAMLWSENITDLTLGCLPITSFHVNLWDTLQ